VDQMNNLTEIQQSILDCITKHESITRKELVSKLNRARTTIFNNLFKLQKKGLITKFSRSKDPRKGGSPYIFWCLIDYPLIEYHKEQHRLQKEEYRKRNIRELRERFKK